MQKALQLLTALEEAAPISDMGSDFKGSHGLMLKKDEPTALQLNVWRHGRSWPVYIRPEDFDTGASEMVRDIVELIDKANAQLN